MGAHPKLQMLEQVKDAVLARAVHAPRFVDGRYLEGTFQAACSAQADEIQNSCLQKLAAGALLRARHLLCTGADYEICSFVSEKNTQVDAVQFVMTTPAIEEAEARRAPAQEAQTLSLWQRLLALFQ